jgi:hypothetical protein
MLYVIATMAHTGALGVLLTFASRPLYPAYVGRTAAWGLTALEDQQLAGLVMWIPAGVGYLVAALVFTRRWIDSSGRLATRTALVAVLTLGGSGSAYAPRGPDARGAAGALNGLSGARGQHQRVHRGHFATGVGTDRRQAPHDLAVERPRKMEAKARGGGIKPATQRRVDPVAQGLPEASSPSTGRGLPSSAACAWVPSRRS